MADIPELAELPWARFFLADPHALHDIEAALRERLDPSLLPECRPVHLRIHPAERIAVEAWAEQFSTSEPDVLESIVALVQFVLTRQPRALFHHSKTPISPLFSCEEIGGEIGGEILVGQC